MQTFDILLSKGSFPYQWFDILSKLDYPNLPEKKEFFNDMTKTECPDETYHVMQKLWKNLKMKTFKDFHHQYLLRDVFILRCES